jgi:glyoxylase-like metal-dependent hydrolase (beta-lactamase superfamily II)
MQGPDSVLLDDMRNKGIDREAVDIVVFTRIHPDHVGWNLTAGIPNFPKARYLLPQRERDHWTQPSIMEGSPYVANQVLPLKDLNILDFIDGEYKITGELTTMPTPGHTPGHSSIVIASGGEHGFILGDVAHNPIQAHYTDWNMRLDVDRDLSRTTRPSVLDMLEAEGYLVYASHFPDPGFGRFVRSETRRYWQGI